MKCKKSRKAVQDELEINRNATPLRQMSITELFKSSKSCDKDKHLFKPNQSMASQCNIIENRSPNKRNAKIIISDVLCFNSPKDFSFADNPLSALSDLVTCEMGTSTTDKPDQIASAETTDKSKTFKRKLTYNDQEQNYTKSPKKNNDTNNNGQSGQSTTESTMKPSTSEKSPKKSPKKSNNTSPNKNSSDSINKLKPKEGKQLQGKQLDELVKLFEGVSRNPHTRTLITKYEYKILKKFILFENDVKYIIMKLFLYKRNWYNIFSFCKKAKLVLEDDKDIVEIFQLLEKEEFVDTKYNKEENLVELLNTLEHDKIKEIMSELKIKPIKTKGENITHILLICEKQKTLPWVKSLKQLVLERIENKMGFSFKIMDNVYDTFFEICMLATFMNPEFQDLQAYFQNVVTCQVVFPYASVEDYPVFLSRIDFLNYVDAIKVNMELEKAMTVKETKLGILHIGNQVYDKLQKLSFTERDEKAPHLYRFKAEHIYCKVLSVCCEQVFTKKDGYPSDVRKWLEYLINKFPESRRVGFWYQKLIWLHMRHLQEIDFEKAASLLLTILSEKKKYKLTITSLYDLAKLGKQLKNSKKYKVSSLTHDKIAEVMPKLIKETEIPQEEINSRSLTSLTKTGQKKVYINKSEDEVTIQGVEQVALIHYSDNGYPEGIHCESSIINSLFMLFFWDIIYDPPHHITGTFLASFQFAPLDMFTEYFYKNRESLIVKRIEDIDSAWPNEEVANFAARNWQKHSHESSAFGLIEKVIPDKQQVSDLITVIGRKLLSKIFDRLTRDLRTFRSGMPDLLVWNTETKKCKFIEVKSDNDRLSVSQLLWLKYLKDNKADVAVCWVHTTGAKRKSLKTKKNE